MRNMNKTITGATLALLLAAAVILPQGANAQTSNTTSNTSGSNTSGTSYTGNMPELYMTQGGTVSNGAGSSALTPGWYYMQSGNRVYYYGNGTYYDPVTQTYGGSVSNPNGTAGAYTYTVNNSSGSNAGTSVTPSVPNTGAGGDAPLNWFLLLASGTIAVGGALYLTKQIAFS
jgi:hypothetical protein